MKLFIDNTLLYEIIRNVLGKGKRTKRKLPISDNQRAGRDRFTAASAYAKMQMKDAVMKAMYQAHVGKNKTSAYSVALADALNAPEVKYINTSNYYGVAGNIIIIKAVDDFKVKRVSVIIKNGDGVVIERSDAIKDKRRPFIWRYTAVVMNPCLTDTTISATAYDFPGNQATLEKVCEHTCHPPSPPARKRVSGPGTLNHKSHEQL